MKLRRKIGGSLGASGALSLLICGLAAPFFLVFFTFIFGDWDLSSKFSGNLLKSISSLSGILELISNYTIISGVCLVNMFPFWLLYIFGCRYLRVRSFLSAVVFGVLAGAVYSLIAFIKSFPDDAVLQFIGYAMANTLSVTTLFWYCLFRFFGWPRPAPPETVLEVFE